MYFDVVIKILIIIFFWDGIILFDWFILCLGEIIVKNEYFNDFDDISVIDVSLCGINVVLEIMVGDKKVIL